MDIVKKTLDALEVLEAEGITVQQGWYDADIKGLHVTVWNLGDYGGEHSDDDEEVEIAAVQVRHPSGMRLLWSLVRHVQC